MQPVTRVVLSTCGRCTIPKKKRIKKKNGYVRRRHSFLPFALFFPRNPYMSMLVGLSQQTTPMTTRLKFHGKLHELECVLALFLSLLSLALWTNRFYMIPLCALTAPDRPVAVLSDPRSPSLVPRLRHPLVPVGWLVRDRSHPRFLIHPHLHRLHPQPVSRHTIYICVTGCIQPLYASEYPPRPPPPLPAGSGMELVALVSLAPMRRVNVTVYWVIHRSNVFASSLRPFPKIATKTSPLVARSSYTGSRH